MQWRCSYWNTIRRLNPCDFLLKYSLPSSILVLNPVSVLTRSSRLGSHPDWLAGCQSLGGVLWGSASFPLDWWLIRSRYWDGSRGLVQFHAFCFLLFLQQWCFFFTLTLFLLLLFWVSVIVLWITEIQRQASDELVRAKRTQIHAHTYKQCQSLTAIILISPAPHLSLPSSPSFFGGRSSILCILHLTGAVLSMASHGVLKEHTVCEYVDFLKLLAKAEPPVSWLQVCAGYKEKCPYPASEGLATFGADERSWNKVGIMVAFEVHVQQLLLSEGLLTLAAGVWFLSSMGSTMHYHVTLLHPAAGDTVKKAQLYRYRYKFYTVLCYM